MLVIFGSGCARPRHPLAQKWDQAKHVYNWAKETVQEVVDKEAARIERENNADKQG